MRWDNLKVDSPEQNGTPLPGYRDPAVVRRFDAPEAMDIRFYEVRARSAINQVPKQSRMFFRWTINPYRGCSHACIYCFARPTHKFLDMDAGRDFEREIVVKVNVPELVRAELGRPSWKREHVAMGTNTDPYQWVEGRYRLMPGIWEAMRDFANPCSILTKSPLVLRDLPLLKQVAERTEVVANFSVPTIDEKVWRQTEPHTPNPRARMEAVAEMNRNGIPSGILIAPLMPGVNDQPEQVEKILELATEAGAINAIGIPLHLRADVRGLFFDWLRTHRPDLIPRYEQLYRRGAYVPKEEKARIAGLMRRGNFKPRAAPVRGRSAAPQRGAERDREPGRAPGRDAPRGRQPSLF